MAEQQKFGDNVELREAATTVLKKCGEDREIWVQVQALMNSADDTLSGPEVLEELRAIEATGIIQIDGNSGYGQPQAGT